MNIPSNEHHQELSALKGLFCGTYTPQFLGHLP